VLKLLNYRLGKETTAISIGCGNSLFGIWRDFGRGAGVVISSGMNLVSKFYDRRGLA